MNTVFFNCPMCGGPLRSEEKSGREILYSCQDKKCNTTLYQSYDSKKLCYSDGIYLKNTNRSGTGNKIWNLYFGKALTAEQWKKVSDGESIQGFEPSATKDAKLRCKKCNGTEVNSDSVLYRHLWAVVLGTFLIILGIGWIIWAIPVARTIPGGLNVTSPLIITFIPGVFLLAYGLRQVPKYFYTCKSCGNIWRRSTKEGPEKEDYSRFVDWQIIRLTDNTFKIREEAAKWLGEHQSVSAVESLIKCLGDRQIGQHDARLETILALKNIGDERAIQPLIDTAMDTGWGNSDVRVEAIKALSTFDNDKIREVLDIASHDKKTVVREAAIESLKKMNNKI